MNCRPGCAACCIVLSISTPIPGMPDGKPAHVRCVQLDASGRCKLFGAPARPRVCVNLRPEPEMCGATTRDAIVSLRRLERATRPHADSVLRS
jgi:Fe-S-cluster containining protein